MDQETRLALLEQSYKQVEARLDKVEVKIDNLKDDMNAGQKALIKTVYVTMAGMTMVIISAIGVMLAMS
jgi:tetrahydromethanopterin S-methyltransferase subunit G